MLRTLVSKQIGHFAVVDCFSLSIFISFIYLWLHWVFVAACSLVVVLGLLVAAASLVVEHRL